MNVFGCPYCRFSDVWKRRCTDNLKHYKCNEYNFQESWNFVRDSLPEADVDVEVFCKYKGYNSQKIYISHSEFNPERGWSVSDDVYAWRYYDRETKDLRAYLELTQLEKKNE